MSKVSPTSLRLFVIISIPAVAVLSFLSPSWTRLNPVAKSCFVVMASTTASTASTTPVASTSASLPRWDLSIFGFDSPFSTQVDEHLDVTKTMAIRFKDLFESNIKVFDNNSTITTNESSCTSNLLEAIEMYETIMTRKAVVSSYLSLSYDTELDNDSLKKRKGALSQTQSEITGNYLEWFELDVAGMSQDELDRHLKAEPGLAKYKAYVDELRRQQPHNLDKSVERALTVRSPYSGTRPLVSFFDKELSIMRFELTAATAPALGGDDDDLQQQQQQQLSQTVNMEVLLSRLSSSKDAKVRAECLHLLNEGLGGAVSRVAALSLSNVAGSWLIENKERSYQNLRSRRNLDNNCPDDVVDSLLHGVRSAGVVLCKRYYAMKKQILKQTQGLKKFTWSDRNAPIDVTSGSKKNSSNHSGNHSEEKKEDDGTITWEAAVEMVERGYRKFSPKMADLFMGMVNEKRIDVPAALGKKGGAYCAGVVPGIGPFQLLNFDGTKQDVSTLAHESGHGCHDILAYKNGYLQYHPPLTLAETASIFGEMIVFRDLLALSKSKEEKLSLLMSKIDDVINSVVRQCSFDRFEELAHTARANGELSSEELDAFWLQAIKEYYGTPGEDSPFDSYDDVSHLWSYVPHFHHVPFYVYSYAFADLVVGALYNSFLTNPDGFETRLLDLLAAGGTRDFATALEPFGLDPTSPTFWESAINAHLGGLMTEAESLATELGYIQEATCSS